MTKANVAAEELIQSCTGLEKAMSDSGKQVRDGKLSDEMETKRSL